MKAPEAARHGRVLVARLDSVGDVLLAGPAVRAVAATAAHVTMLVSHRGRPAAELLPGVDEVIEFDAPWVLDPAPPVRPRDLRRLVRSCSGYDMALLLTSFHQSALPLALLLRQAGVGWIGAISADFPGTLLDLRHPDPGEVPEAVRSVGLVTTAGFAAPAEPERLRVKTPLPDPLGSLRPYVVYHPGAAVAARRPSPTVARAHVAALVRAGHRVVVTGSRSESQLTAEVSGPDAVDLGGSLGFAALAGVLAHAAVVVAPNTGPAHLAACVGTPVVSLFAPTVSARRWAPTGVPVVLLGDQAAPCQQSRARLCPVPDHPCLDSVTPVAVVEAVGGLLDARPRSPVPILNGAR